MSVLGSFKKSRAELISEIDDLREQLVEENLAFDSGKTQRAKRISSIVCKLFHDGSGKSLTAQLRIRKSMCFPDGLRAKIGLKEVGLPLCLLQIGQAMSEWGYRPIHSSQGLTELPWSPFSHWWNGEVFASSSGRLTRKQLATVMRNTEADHVDPEIRQAAYVSMKRHDNLAIKFFICEDDALAVEAFGRRFYFTKTMPSTNAAPRVISGPSFLLGAEFVTMRQIGYEVELALGALLAVLQAGAE